jgi:hypothetical protein
MSDTTPAIAAYNRAQAEELLRSTTTSRLRADLRFGSFGLGLSPPAAEELDGLLAAWEQRALGQMPLRDALLVDTERGPRAYALVCAALTSERVPVAAPLAIYLPEAPCVLDQLPAPLSGEPALADLANRAGLDGLTLAWQTRPDSFPPPAGLELLRPAPPSQPPRPQERFEPPSGWRRSLAALLAALGVILLTGPLLVGHIPESPAGLPLAMITLALIIGIRAGWPGFLGAACIWLVANLPGFRHGVAISSLWPALPLLAAGLLLLSLDRRVRAMWAWLRRRRGRAS